MPEFMFGVLGSVTFWIVFFVVGFVVGSIIMKKFAPDTFNHITKGITHPDVWPLPYVSMVCICCYCLWPVFLVGFIIKFVFEKIVGPSFGKAVTVAANIIPEFEIKTKKEETK